MLSDDTQFIIESDDELPAETGKQKGNEIMEDTVRGGDRCEGKQGLT